MKTNYFSRISLATLVFAGFIGTSCSSSDDPQATKRLIIDAEKSADYVDVTTRALSEGSGVIDFTWATTDNVFVYTSDWGTNLGKLNPKAAETGKVRTKLDGDVSSSGVKVGDWLKLIMPRQTWDYTEQDGTLDKIASTYDYACAEAVVTKIDDGKIYAGNALFGSEQAIVKFVLQKNDGTALNVSALTISASSDKLVQKCSLNGTATAYGALTITPSGEKNVFYVALRNENTAADSYTLSAENCNDKYSYTKSNVTFTKGKFKTITVKMKFIDDTYTEREGYAGDGSEIWE